MAMDSPDEVCKESRKLTTEFPLRLKVHVKIPLSYIFGQKQISIQHSKIFNLWIIRLSYTELVRCRVIFQTPLSHRGHVVAGEYNLS
jgi:hypothetical protein